MRNPDLALHYARSAPLDWPDLNPVIVIPGALGTRLTEDGTDRPVWGAFGGDYASPRKPEGQRLFALPMQEGVPLRELRDSVRADGVLDRLKIRYAGLPLYFRSYFFILSTLSAGGYRDELLGAEEGEIDDDDHGYNCFQFDYDWRRDNVENAARLYDFIEAKRAHVQESLQQRYGVKDADVRFDIVAHSMGALLTRYFLRYGDADLPQDGSVPPVTWKGAAHVERVVLLAPPNAGSVVALQQLLGGREFGPVLPRYSETLLGTFPSGYQMLPRPRHRAVVHAGNHARPIEDLMDPEFWERMGWGLASPRNDKALAVLLPDVEDPAQRRRIALDHLRKSLARARQFAAALDGPAAPPDGVHLFLMAGDSQQTPARLAVDISTGRTEVIEHAPGDGKILRSSALMDERLGGTWGPTLRSPIAWKQVTFLFSRHMELTHHPAFVDNLLYLLLEDPR